MRNALLEQARIQAKKAEPGIRAAALLRIARAYASGDLSQAREVLREGLDAVAALVVPERDLFFREAREVTAAIDPDLLAKIPVGRSRGPAAFASRGVVQAMLSHGHVDAAFRYMLQEDDPAAFSFPWLGNLLHKLEQPTPAGADRRQVLLRHAFDMWRRSVPGRHLNQRSHFVRILGHFWQVFPEEEARSIVRALVDQTLEERDAGTSSGFGNGIHFSSARQNTFFQVIHILQHLDPVLAQRLISSHDQLADAVRRYPKGLETLSEEAKAETERRKANGANCGGGYALAGDPKDFPRQRRLIDASRSGDFAPSIEDALGKYQEDISSVAPNYGLKEYWPSTGAFRTLFYQAGKRLGSDAEELLKQVPDDDLRLFATIELAAALAGVPESSIHTVKRQHPTDLSRPQSNRLASFQVKQDESRTEAPKIQSSDGRQVRCPICLFHPSEDTRWTCTCGHTWNTFWTSGRCPACHFQWETTQCSSCGEMSEHRAWYIANGEL